MSQILKLTHENQKLKRQINQYQQVLGVSPYVDDSLFKGGYRVVKTINDRDNINCCHSKQGMIVCVIGGDLSFKEYRLISDCKNKQWEEIQTQVTENDVILVEDYSELSENLTTQKELNLVLKEIILNLQNQIDNIELIDSEVIITEDTNFAQIGDTQKDFNKNISDYKETIDIKNIEQDERIENLEGINYTWSPTNRTLTLYDNNGNQLSQVSLISLDNEGTDLRYNASTLSLELYNADNELLDSIPVSSFIGSVGTQLQLNSNQLQLKDSQGNILSTVNFSINNIQGLQTALDNKLNKPTTTGNTTTHPFVVGEDGSGNSARLPAGDLGKNFFNSDLNNTTARNHTMNAGIAVNTLGNPHTLSGLPNKNTDIANFRKIRVQNVTGLDAVIDSKNLAIDIPNVLSEAEKTTWKTEMNGGWTTAAMSVAIITPPIVDKQDKNYWLSIKGANLNLNPANFSVQIMDSTGTNVVATVPNSQVQLYSNGIDLTFYYNFKDLPTEQYRIRLNNGVATMTTGANVSLTVVQLLQYQDLSATSWSKKLWNNNTTSTLSSGSGNSAVYIPDPSVKSLANDGSFVCALLSQQIIPENQDFQIEFTISVTSNSGGKLASYIAGLVPSASSVELTNQTNFGVSLKSNDAALKVDYFRDNDISVWISTNTNQNSATFKVIATRRGGIITSLYEGLTSIAFAQKSYTNSALKIGLYTQNTAIGDLNVGLNINSLVFF